MPSPHVIQILRSKTRLSDEEIGSAFPLSDSDLPAGWTEESPTVIGYDIGLIYSF